MSDLASHYGLKSDIEASPKSRHKRTNRVPIHLGQRVENVGGNHAVARGQNARRRLERPRCAGELVIEAPRGDRPLRDRHHRGFGRRQVL
jgi:hypothetical protein